MSAVLVNIVQTRNQHSLWVHETNLCSILIVCSRCGAWVETRAFSLLLPCPGKPPSGAGTTALRKLTAGKHPTKAGITVSSAVALPENFGE